MKKKEFIIVLDFITGKVFIFEYDKNIVEDIHDFYELVNKRYNLNLSDSNCQYMVTKEHLTITQF